MSKKTTIYFVDDHQMLIDGLKALMVKEKNFEIVGESTSSLKALEQVKKIKPEVVVIDINMPELSGIDLTRKLKEEMPNIKILALSMFGEKAMVSEMLDAGANGYILKNTGKEELVSALNKIAEGGIYFSSEVAAEMMKAMSERSLIKEQEKKEINLTIREKEIITLIAKELSNAQIGDKLFISERTVESHRKNIFRKTSTKTVVGLIKYAIEAGIVKL
jgi:DNA-binding NarL/FixJ family response regulator